MLTLLSPAKKLLKSFEPFQLDATHPSFVKKTNELAQLMKTKSVKDIANLMELSADLAELNYQRFQDFKQRDISLEESYPAVYLFQGDVYQGLQAATWDTKTVHFSQSHLGILSGLYGLLKPLDLIQPYRLEMGVHLHNNEGTNLYEFWRQTLTKAVNEQLASHANPVLINLASNEYFKAVDEKTLIHPIATINFYEKKQDVEKMIGIFAKKARGAMAKFIMEHQIDSLDEIKAFEVLDYRFRASTSSEYHLDFVRTHKQ